MMAKIKAALNEIKLRPSPTKGFTQTSITVTFKNSDYLPCQI
jgi:hypothetical protein